MKVGNVYYFTNNLLYETGNKNQDMVSDLQEIFISISFLLFTRKPNVK